MTGSTKGRAFMPRVVELRAENEWLGPMLDPLLAARASIAAQLKIVSANVLDTAREDADVRRIGRQGRSTTRVPFLQTLPTALLGTQQLQVLLVDFSSQC
jgi:hypothetical protein